jgi:hypothetical protein
MNLNVKTTIPLFVALGALPFLIGGVFWLSSVDAKATSADKKTDMLYDIKSDLAEIKTDIKYLKQRRK